MGAPAMRKDQDDVKASVLDCYQENKSRYLSVCRRHGLNPFDLGIMTVRGLRIPGHEKRHLVRLVLLLVRLERELKGKVGQGLFPLTIKELERTGYLVPVHR